VVSENTRCFSSCATEQLNPQCAPIKAAFLHRLLNSQQKLEACLSLASSGFPCKCSRKSSHNSSMQQGSALRDRLPLLSDTLPAISVRLQHGTPPRKSASRTGQPKLHFVTVCATSGLGATRITPLQCDPGSSAYRSDGLARALLTVSFGRILKRARKPRNVLVALSREV
jgi:hypothetical protein